MNTLLIDNIDVYATYGICITDKSYNALIAYPQLKKPSRVNDWAEEDGEDIDLTSLELLPREFDLSFATKKQDKVNDFLKMLSAKTYHEFYFGEIKRGYKLRLVSQPNKKIGATLETFSLRFAEDVPKSGDKAAVPSSDMVSQRGYVLDDRDLSEYGVYVLDGSDAEILKLPEVKKNIITHTPLDDALKYRAKNVNLSCLMLAKDLDEFWRNYDALLAVLIQDDPRTLYYEAKDEEYSCYYNSSSVSNFSITDRVWFQFTLSLTFTSFGVSQVDDCVLSTENDHVIITEQGKYFINLNV